MRYLGIDYGKKRVGLALSDEAGRLAFPLKTIASKNIIPVLKTIVEREGAEKIVVGLPIPFGGGESEMAKSVIGFGKRLSRAVGVPVDFENEILTTKMARKSGIRRDHLDKSAAAIILQSYLDKSGSGIKN